MLHKGYFWIEKMMNDFLKEKADIVFGPWLPIDCKGLLTKYRGVFCYAMNPKLKCKEKTVLNLSNKFINPATCNFAFRKKVFEEVGMFSQKYKQGTEDSDFTVKAIKKGYKVVFSPDIIVFHKDEMSFKRFLKKFYEYGKNTFKFRKANGEVPYFAFKLPFPYIEDVITAVIFFLLLFGSSFVYIPILLLTWYALKIIKNYISFKEGFRHIFSLKLLLSMPFITTTEKLLRISGFIDAFLTDKKLK